MKPFHTYVIIVALFIATSVSLAQNPGTNKDTGVVDELNLTAWKLRNNDLDASKNYALKALVQAEKINYQKGVAFSYNVLGHYYKMNSLYDTSLKYYNKSLHIRQVQKDTIGILSSLRNVVSIYKLKGNNTLAIQTANKALSMAAKNNSTKVQIEAARIKNNLSAIYLKNGNYKAAIKIALEAKSFFTTNNQPDELASVYISLGNIYELQKEYNKALTQFQAASKIYQEQNNQRDLAKTYNNIGNIYYATDNYTAALSNYKKSFAIRRQNNFKEDIQGSLYSIGNIYDSFGKPDSALLFFKESLKLSSASGNTNGQCESHTAIGEILLNNNKTTEAIDHLKKAYYLSDASGALPQKLILLKQLSTAYKTIGKKDSALIYSEEYNRLNDSLSEILRRSIQYEATIKNKEYDLKLSQEKNKLQMYIITGLILSVIFMLIILVLAYKSAKAQKNMRKLKDIIKEQEFIAMDAMLEGQETERKRLSRELHDTMGSILTATKFAFKSMEDSLEKVVAENKSQYLKINGMLDEAMETVRKISHDMATGVIVEKGIEGALTQLCERLETSGKLKIVLTIFGFDEKVDPAVELELYRIIQELLTNILKHAQAQNVSIQLTKSNTNINLMVEDDGTGFNTANLAKKPGIGIKNINERLKKLNGKCNIDSGKGRGTTVIVDVPLNGENN